MTDRWKNILIGTFVVAAFAIGVALVLFLKPTYGDGKKIMKVRFANIAGINQGTRVTYAGRPIGQVLKIDVIPNARDEKGDESGRVYSYQLSLRIDSKISVYPNDEIAICTYGLMGEKSVAIIPKANSSGEPQQPVGDQIIYANSIDAFESTFNQIGRVAAKAERTIERFDEWFKQNGPTLSSAAESLSSLLGVIEKERLIPSLKNSLDIATDNMRLLRTAIQDDKLLTRLGSLVDDLDRTMVIFNKDAPRLVSDLSQITREIAGGSGTLGRFIKGDDFYLRLSSLMSKSETLMNDVNHYGLLFQYNKQWQRSRSKKATLMTSLDSPQDFKTYFEGEIDAISTSIGRITEVLDRADQDKEREKIMHNDAFKRDFAVLMRQVKALNDAIKLFNQDLVAKMEPSP